MHQSTNSSIYQQLIHDQIYQIDGVESEPREPLPLIWEVDDASKNRPKVQIFSAEARALSISCISRRPIEMNLSFLAQLYQMSDSDQYRFVIRRIRINKCQIMSVHNL